MVRDDEGGPGGAGPAAQAVEELTYTDASSELDEIVAFFEQREIDVDQLVSKLERATAIVDELDRRLRRTRLQVEELVPRLEAAVVDREVDADDTVDAAGDDPGPPAEATGTPTDEPLRRRAARSRGPGSAGDGEPDAQGLF